MFWPNYAPCSIACPRRQSAPKSRPGLSSFHATNGSIRCRARAGAAEQRYAISRLHRSRHVPDCRYAGRFCRSGPRMDSAFIHLRETAVPVIHSILATGPEQSEISLLLGFCLQMIPASSNERSNSSHCSSWVPSCSSPPRPDVPCTGKMICRQPGTGAVSRGCEHRCRPEWRAQMNVMPE
jgi:hypothetical protein